MFLLQKFLVLLSVAFAVVESIPVAPNEQIPIVRQINEVNFDGTYKNS